MREFWAVVVALWLATTCAAVHPSTGAFSKTQEIYNLAACASDRPARALDNAHRLTEGFSDPETYRQFVLKLAAYGVPRHANHAAPSYVAIVEKRQGIESSEDLIFRHFCSAVTEFSDYVSYVAAGGDDPGIEAPDDAAAHQPDPRKTVEITRFDAARCDDPAVFATLERAAQNQLYNPKAVVDPPGVHYLRAVMDSALLGITTYADEVARARPDDDQFAAFCETVKSSSLALLRAQRDYNEEMSGDRAAKARENQSLGLEAIKEKGLRDEAERNRREDLQ